MLVTNAVASRRAVAVSLDGPSESADSATMRTLMASLLAVIVSVSVIPLSSTAVQVHTPLVRCQRGFPTPAVRQAYATHLWLSRIGSWTTTEHAAVSTGFAATRISLVRSALSCDSSWIASAACMECRPSTRPEGDLKL